mmetsp:Transcript_41/g.110  ORF Transcript_41/g.110 Transcript_41/m.110 type:complete len:319 (-) Transcript_41:585-1541(-)
MPLRVVAGKRLKLHLPRQGRSQPGPLPLLHRAVSESQHRREVELLHEVTACSVSFSHDIENKPVLTSHGQSRAIAAHKGVGEPGLAAAHRLTETLEDAAGVVVNCAAMNHELHRSISQAGSTLRYIRQHHQLPVPIVHRYGGVHRVVVASDWLGHLQRWIRGTPFVPVAGDHLTAVGICVESTIRFQSGVVAHGNLLAHGARGVGPRSVFGDWADSPLHLNKWFIFHQANDVRHPITVDLSHLCNHGSLDNLQRGLATGARVEQLGIVLGKRPRHPLLGVGSEYVRAARLCATSLPRLQSTGTRRASTGRRPIVSPLD